MSLSGAENLSDAAASATWIEVQFAADPNPLATGAVGSHAMEKLLIDAQRESGQSSLVQSGSASPAIAGSGSRSPQILAEASAGGNLNILTKTLPGAIRFPPPSAVLIQGGPSVHSSGGTSDWHRDWPTRFVAWQAPGARQFHVWRYLSLRKTGLMRGGPLLLSLLSHAASFLLGAVSMYIVCRSFGSGGSPSMREQRVFVW